MSSQNQPAFQAKIKTSFLIISEILKPMEMLLRKLKKMRIFSMTFSKDCRMYHDHTVTTLTLIKSEEKRKASGS